MRFPIPQVFLSLLFFEPVNTHLAVCQVLYKIKANYFVNDIDPESAIFLEGVKEEEAEKSSPY